MNQPTETPQETPRAAINTNVRLFDLVRYMRSDLLAEKLITEEEYTWLCAESPMATCAEGGSPSPRRLEDYDQIQAELTRLRAALTGQWQPIETAPREEVTGFLVLVAGAVVQVSWFEGNLYPDYLDANVDYGDRVLGATHWQPLPAPPTP